MKPVGVTLVLLLFGISTGFAQWSSYSWENTPVCTAPGDQYDVHIVPDGSGGMFFIWQDDMSSPVNNTDLFAQHFDANGRPSWLDRGIPVCTAPKAQTQLQCTHDGAGGFIAVWNDGNGGIYAQRIDPGGQQLWPQNGAPVSNVLSYWAFPQVVPDQMGGAIIVWADARTGRNNVYAQRLLPDGSEAWPANDVLLSSGGSSTWLYPQIASDSAGGAVVVWKDHTNGVYYTQRIHSDGSLAWKSGGVEVCPHSQSPEWVRIVSDGSGGAYIVWVDFRSGGGDIYAQHVDDKGFIQWGQEGHLVCGMGGDQRNPDVITDGAQGFIVVWEDGRNSLRPALYAQRIQPDPAHGDPIKLWHPGGAVVCDEPDAKPQLPQAVTDMNHGVIIVWCDRRNQTTQDDDVYIQRLDGNGSARWTVNGEAVSTASHKQIYPQLISNDASGAYIVWEDMRHNGLNEDVYAALINRDGVLVPVELSAFAGSVAENSLVELTWATENEQNNHGFEIQRSLDGITWESVAFVAGAGTSDERREYGYLDDISAVPARDGVVYYRLRQLDYDGAQSYSPVIFVSLDAAPSDMRLSSPYPNPFGNLSNVTLTLNTDALVTAELFDAAGKLVRRLYDGSFLTKGSVSLRIDGSRLGPGRYILRVSTPSSIAWRSLVVQR